MRWTNASSAKKAGSVGVRTTRGIRLTGQAGFCGNLVKAAAGAGSASKDPMTNIAILLDHVFRIEIKKDVPRPKP